MNLYLWDESGHFAGVVEWGNGPVPLRATQTPPPSPAAGHRIMWRGEWVQEPLPEPTLEELKAALLRDATAARWQHETGGISVAGVRVLTGIEDQNRIASALIGAPETVDFKADSGWVRLTLLELQGIAAAITAHVQACFSAERAHHEAIEALPDVPAAQDYNTSEGWPE